MKSSNNYKKNTKSGFTLIELMVTIIIMMIMTSVVIFNYNRFNESSLLNALAYDLSLTIRQAQVYGTAVRENKDKLYLEPITTNSFDTLGFTYSYGVHFEVKDFEGKNEIILFANKDTKNYYSRDQDPPLSTYTLQRGIKIKKWCVTIMRQGERSDECEDGTGYNTSLDITFTRPNPEATITIMGAPLIVPGKIDTATIFLTNADESITKSVVVYSTGQISVQ